MIERMDELAPYGRWLEVDWDNGLWRDGTPDGWAEWSPIPAGLADTYHPDVRQAIAAAAEAETQAILAAAALAGDTEQALSDALALRDLYPAPTPEETAIIDAQVADALALYEAVESPQPGLVNLASKVLAWRTGVTL